MSLFFIRPSLKVFLKIKPYREEVYRYFIYNDKTQSCYRADGIGSACVLLPEEQGVIFVGLHTFYLLKPP